MGHRKGEGVAWDAPLHPAQGEVGIRVGAGGAIEFMPYFDASGIFML
jgi:hypothetical protein